MACRSTSTKVPLAPAPWWQRFRIVISSMAKKSAVKTSAISRVTRVAPRDPERYCRGLEGWPRSWMGQEKDLPPGELLVGCFRLFLEELVASGLSPKTIQKHVDNLWALGGEIIRGLHEDPSLRRKSTEQILHSRIDEEGGPLIYAMESEEDQQRSFDSTCKKLHRFLNQAPC